MPDISKIVAFENGDMDIDEVVDFIQGGIDAGWVWQLQGFYVRVALHLIEQGLCHP